MTSLGTLLIIAASFFGLDAIDAFDNLEKPVHEHGPVFQWPMDPVTHAQLSGTNDFASYSTSHSNYYHTGIDLRSGKYDPDQETAAGYWSEYVTPVKAAAEGTIVGLFSTFDTLYRCGGIEIDSAETYVSPSGAINRGLGNVVIIEHDNGIYSLYGHLDCIAPAIELGERVARGTLIGKMGHSTTARRDPHVSPHLHFETKDVIRAHPSSDELLGNPVGGIYWGYTPDLPTGYGYHDPREFIHPFTAEPIAPRPIRIVDGRRGYLDVRTGPGRRYARLTRFLVGHEFVAYQACENGSELWYRIKLPHAMGKASGWIAAGDQDCRNQSCIVDDPSAPQVEVTKRTRLIGRLGDLFPTMKLHDKIYDYFREIYAWRGDRYVTAGSPEYGPGCAGPYYPVYLPSPENPYGPAAGDGRAWICGDFLSRE